MIFRAYLGDWKVERELHMRIAKCNFHISWGPQTFSLQLTLFLGPTNFYISSLLNLPLFSISTLLPSILTFNFISQFQSTKRTLNKWEINARWFVGISKGETADIGKLILLHTQCKDRTLDNLLGWMNHCHSTTHPRFLL